MKCKIFVGFVIKALGTCQVMHYVTSEGMSNVHIA